jgi:hypothetical protein
MRIFSLIVLIILFNQAVMAQSFRVDSESKYSGNIGSQIKVVINIKNLTNKPLHLQVKKIGGISAAVKAAFFAGEMNVLIQVLFLSLLPKLLNLPDLHLN